MCPKELPLFVLTFIIGINFMGCSSQNTIDDGTPPFMDLFGTGKEVFYKGHLVREFNRKGVNPKLDSYGKITSRYFGYEDTDGKIVRHGLSIGDGDNGEKGEMLFFEGKAEGECIMWDKAGNVIVKGVYKDNMPWEGTFGFPHDESVIQTFNNGNLVKFQDNGKTIAEGEWKDNKKWEGSFLNFENMNIEYYKNGELINTVKLGE